VQRQLATSKVAEPLVPEKSAAGYECPGEPSPEPSLARRSRPHYETDGPKSGQGYLESEETYLEQQLRHRHVHHAAGVCEAPVQKAEVAEWACDEQ
jgi:hypothetical protein